MNTKELNEKLLKFAGFIKILKPEWSQNDNKNLRWIYPNGQKYSTHPNLITSLDLQAKWIYPKIAEAQLEIQLHKDWDIQWRNHPYVCQIIKSSHYQVGYGEDNDSMSIAFALAVEKYIDGLNKTEV
ncbi:MAG: hypothetical protein WC389_13955 [Lutibacter sp.]|jgi:hypothetical protein